MSTIASTMVDKVIESPEQSFNQLTTGAYRKRAKCARCRNHGVLVLVKGHTRKCKYRTCNCMLCTIITKRHRCTAAGHRRRMQSKLEAKIKNGKKKSEFQENAYKLVNGLISEISKFQKDNSMSFKFVTSDETNINDDEKSETHNDDERSLMNTINKIILILSKKGIEPEKFAMFSFAALLINNNNDIELAVSKIMREMKEIVSKFIIYNKMTEKSEKSSQKLSSVSTFSSQQFPNVMDSSSTIVHDQYNQNPILKSELNFSVETINSNTSIRSSLVSTVPTDETPQYSPILFALLNDQTSVGNLFIDFPESVYTDESVHVINQ